MLVTYDRPAILNLYCYTEFILRYEFDEYVKMQGTVLHKTVPHTSALNGNAA